MGVGKVMKKFMFGVCSVLRWFRLKLFGLSMLVMLKIGFSLCLLLIRWW